jgi:hypothetical protein
LTVQLAEAFGSKPVRPSLLELVDQLIDASLLGLSSDEGSHAEQVNADKCEEIHREIERRIDELGGGA